MEAAARRDAAASLIELSDTTDHEYEPEFNKGTQTEPKLTSEASTETDLSAESIAKLEAENQRL